MKTGCYHIGVGLLVMAGFMLYGFLLIERRGFAPDKVAWVASCSVGKCFEARLAHVREALVFVLRGLAPLHLGGVMLQRAHTAGALGRLVPFLGGASPIRERDAR